jgi:hypothetical protein
MPIEPTAIHPRVAAQEAKFIIFGSERELLDQKLVLHASDMKEKHGLRIVLTGITDITVIINKITLLSGETCVKSA